MKPKTEQDTFSIRIIFAVFSIALIITCILVLLLGEKVDTSSAYGFNLFMSKDGERTYNEVRKDADVQKISEAISGKYRSMGHEKSLRDIDRDSTFIIIPAYPDYIGNPDDKYYEFTYGIYADDDELFTALGIYVISDKKIAIWDPDKNKFWIGKKKSGRIDLEYLESMLHVESKKPFQRAY